MPETYKKLAQAQPAITATTLYTVPGGTTALIRHIAVVNTSAIAALTIELYHDGSTTTYQILPAVELGIHHFAQWDGVIVMEAGDTLQAKAGAASNVTVTVYGVEVT